LLAFLIGAGVLTKVKFNKLLLSSVVCILIANPTFAGELKATLSSLLNTHERIKAAQSDLKSALANKGVAEGGYYPTLSLTANVGNENIVTQNPLSTRTETSLAPRELDLNVSQTVLDFGATSATVHGAGLAVKQAKIAVDLARQSLLLEALSAQYNLASAVRVMDYQTQSETSVKKQTELEDARVKRGSGFSTDVLQAKTQLAGAQAARVRAAGTLRQAVNRYRAIFHKVPEDIKALELPKVDENLLPNGEETVVKTALKSNPQILAASVLTRIANSEIKRSFASGYRPVLNASAGHKYKRDVSGTIGNKSETLIKLEMTYNFNMGWTAENTLKASKSGLSAASSRLKDTRDQIEEQARNAWQNLQTARDNAEFLSNQANISAEFLTLARKERTLGQRSLIDVLAGETSLINAQAAADRAMTDVTIAKLTVLNVMGQLKVSVLN